MIFTEQWHPSHPDHKLILIHSEAPYTCDGCMEPGFGSRYRCEPCNYDLHKDCLFSTSSTTHAFYKKCEFKYFDRAPGNRTRHCDACGRDIKGFVYHCESSGRDLHPCCRNLPCMIQVDEEVKLFLCEKVSSKCCKCKRRELWKGFTGWSYRSKCKNYHIHVACVKDMLVDKWLNYYFCQGNEYQSNSRALVNGVTDLQLGLQADSSTSGGKLSKYWRIAKIVIQTIVSTILGDPTALISGLIEYLVSS